MLYHSFTEVFAMKINKKDPKHWLYLANFALFVLLSIPLRPLLKRFKRKPIVILYGHKLSGNLLGIKRQLDRGNSNIESFFLTMDPAYFRQNKDFLCAQNPLHILKVVSADCLISDHGLHALIFYLKMTDMKFFDVWHGIPYKGFDSQDFKVQHCYDETWVASPLLAEIYTKQFGFKKSNVAVTGYARTDTIVARTETDNEIFQRLGLRHINSRKLVLFAPTWKQDSEHRSLFPFDKPAEVFLKDITNVCLRNNAILLFRAHLNTGDSIVLPDDSAIAVPFADYPDTEALLRISDVLICDWSSIAFDYLLLDRPALFLDVEPPFRKGFSLGPEYRYGAIIKDFSKLLEQLDRCLSKPDDYWKEYGEHHVTTREKVYGSYADGQSAQRCINRLKGGLAEANELR